MITHSIVLVHNISSNGIEVDKFKVDMVKNNPSPTNIKRIKTYFGACWLL